MKHIFILILITLSFFCFSNEVDPYRPPYNKVSSRLNTKLDTNEAVIRFYFPSVKTDTFSILYSIDGIASKVHMQKNGSLYFKTTPGVHLFQFFYDKKFIEVYARVSVKPQYEDLWRVIFPKPQRVYGPNEVQPKKPVIYLYPEKEREVFVNVKPVGEFILTYPEIKDGWRVVAKPTGELEVDGKKYNYLFWESRQYQVPEISKNLKGYVVEGRNIVEFLNKKLTEVGLNSKEQADFITFWAPKMMDIEKIFIQFQFNEECDKYAHLEIEPKPDNLYRIFMSWRRVNQSIFVQEQKIRKVNREGFTVIEWGGAEFQPFIQ